MKLEQRIKERNVKPFNYAGIDVFTLNKQEVTNLLARVLEIKVGFTFSWEDAPKAT